MIETDRKVPAIRFKGFTDDWEQRKLGAFSKEITRTSSNNDSPVMMITASNGFIRQSERYAFDNAGKSLSKYVLLFKGELAYNHGASKIRPFGSCFSLKSVESARIPYVYHCFSVEKSNPEFISMVLNSKEVEKQLRKIVSSGARMDGLLNISFEDYTSVSLMLPRTVEQNVIVNFINNLDNLITLHQRKHEALKRLKKAMLRRMFPEYDDINPKVRFDKFRDDWEQRKLSSLCEKFTDGDWIEAKDQSDSGVRLIQTGNVGVTEYLDKPNNKKWVTADTFERLRCEEVLPGDILISRLPEPAGRACIMPNLGTKMITAVDCTIVRTFAEYSSKFLVQFLSTHDYFNEVNTALAGGTRQRISRSNLASFDVPTPPTFEEQEAIGNYFKHFDHLITLHQRKYEQLQKLKKAFLKKMFI